MESEGSLLFSRGPATEPDESIPHPQMRMRIKLYSENVKIRAHLGDLAACGRVILKRNLKKWNFKMWTRFNWLAIGSNDGLFWTR
jgi:hypothetical protein